MLAVADTLFAYAVHWRDASKAMTRLIVGTSATANLTYKTDDPDTFAYAYAKL